MVNQKMQMTVQLEPRKAAMKLNLAATAMSLREVSLELNQRRFQYPTEFI